MRYLLSILLLYSMAFAQEEAATQDRAPIFDKDFQHLEKSNEQQIPVPQMLEQAFEKEIDSTSYVLGPGDRLLIKIWGMLDKQFISEITPDGYVIIPSVAEVAISGKTLAKGSELIKKELAGSFKNSGFSIRLVQIRKFRVFVVGEVRTPGAYYLRAVDRVVDAIQLAGGALTWGNETRIQVRHLNGEVDTVNISNFFLEGDLGCNPLLSGGDIVYVPRIDLSKNYVIITGNVGSQGLYQTLPNETLYDFLKRVRALNRRSNIANVIIIRQERKIFFNLLDAEAKVRDEILQTGDRIIIPSLRDRVYVKGEVIQPGPYPYLANYVARDYAGYAGVLGTAKDPKDFYVIRRETNLIEKGPDVIVDRGDIVVIPKSTKENTKETLAIITPILSIMLSTVAIIVSVSK